MSKPSNEERSRLPGHLASGPGPLPRGYFAGGPGNIRDRARFEALSQTDRRWTSDRAAQYYNGSRTIAWCWKRALDECLDPEIVSGSNS